MDYVLYRLGRSILIFLIGLIMCILYIIKKRKFIYAVYFNKDSIKQEYNGKNDIKLLRFLNVFPFIIIIFITLYLREFVLDIPSIVKGQYSYVEGYTTEKSHGGANVSHEKRSIFIKNKTSNEEKEIVVFSEYIDKNEYLKVEYLPHTKYGLILEK